MNNKPKLIEGPVGITLIRLTVPMLIGTMGMVIFNLVDAFFIGKLGTQELAAMSFTLPVVMVVVSFALGLGVGASAVISHAVGAGDHKKVVRLTTDSLILSLIIVSVLVIPGILTIKPLFKMLGASPELLPYITRYMTIWFPGMIFVVVPMVGNNAIRALGDTKTPAIIMLVCVLINIIMDPLLIFGIGPFPRLEIAGAALATVIARSFSLFFSLYVLLFRKKIISLAPAHFSDIIASCKQILYVALPAAATRMMGPLAVGIITKIMSLYGSEAVAAFGVVLRIEFFALAVIIALSAVINPFIGQNRGAGNYHRIKKGLDFSSCFSLGWGVFLFIVLSLLAKPVALLFNSNPDVVSTIVLYLRIVTLGFGLHGIMHISYASFNALNKPLHASIIILTHTFLLYIPASIAGSRLYGITGIFTAIALSYSIAGIISYLFLNKTVLWESRKHNLNGI